jgi:hypothetical protein
MMKVGVYKVKVWRCGGDEDGVDSPSSSADASNLLVTSKAADNPWKSGPSRAALRRPENSGL